MTLPRKDLFDIPTGMIYLNGNSLGPLPKGVAAAVEKTISEQWANQLIKGWNACGWYEQPVRVGNKVAELIGASQGSVVMGDTLSIKVFQSLCAGLAMRPTRKVILSDTGNFPSDLYIAEGLIALKEQGYTLKLEDPEAVVDAIDDTVAVVLLTEVDYRTGRKHDMSELTQKAHSQGAVMIWDLAHSAGALDVNIEQSNCEFAVGCTYKYLNGGPGAPAFIYVRPDLINTAQPSLCGWMGHQTPFGFEQKFLPAKNIERMRIGTPPVIQLSALEEALNVWNDTTMQEIRTASIALCDLFITEIETRCPQLALLSPRNGTTRGSQVSFAFEHGYAAIQALIANNVVGDFRAPNVMRFGFAPLYIDARDVITAVDTLENILDNALWDKPIHKEKNRVT